MDNDGISLELRQERVKRAYEGFLGNGVIKGREAVELVRVMTLMAGLKLEIKGLGMSRGVSCHNIIKRSFGFKGNKQKVLQQLQAYKFANYPPPPYADPCPKCGAKALVKIDAESGLDTSDGAEYLCHPVLEGCNWGFRVG